jgi:hypothetical protein
MKKMLGRAGAVTAGAMMLIGLGATGAWAGVAAGGLSGGLITADKPMVAGMDMGFACAGDAYTTWADAGIVTSDALGGVGGWTAGTGHQHMGSPMGAPMAHHQ